MGGKSRFLIPLLLVMVSFACKNKGNTDTSKAPVEKVLNQESDFKNVPIAQPLSNILSSCQDSENYQKEVWPGENSCSWALEKELLRKLPEYVRRNDQGLSFQTDQSDWRIIAAVNDDNYLLLNEYIPEFHVFILKHYNSNTCPEYWIYDAKTDKMEKLRGMIYLSNNKEHFVTLATNTCSSENMVGRFLKSGGIKKTPFAASEMVSAIKWSEHKLAFFYSENGKSDFQTMNLP